MASPCDEDCCDLQTEVLDLAAELQCELVGSELAEQIAASALLKLLCRSFIVYDAWTPILGVEQQGTELAFKVNDWIGGSGTKPDTGYIGPAGIVDTFGEAVTVNLVISTSGTNVYIGEYEATEDISSLRLVNIHGNDQIRKASATNGYEAHGIITSSATTGDTVSVFSMGLFSGFGGLSAGVSMYLGDNGLIASAVPGTATISQKAGTPKNATNFVLDIEEKTFI